MDGWNLSLDSRAAGSFISDIMSLRETTSDDGDNASVLWSVLQFKRLLNRELHYFSGTTHAGNEISEYICNTFLGKRSYYIYRQ